MIKQCKIINLKKKNTIELKIKKRKIKKLTQRLNLKISLQSFTKEPIREAVYTIKRLKLAHSITSVSLPITKESFTVIRSAHVDKKSREQFKIATHKSHIYLKNIKIFKNRSIFKILPSFKRYVFFKKNVEIKYILFKYFKRILSRVLPAGIKYIFTISWFLNKKTRFFKVKNQYNKVKLITLRKTKRLIKRLIKGIKIKKKKKPLNVRLNNRIRILMKRLN